MQWLKVWLRKWLGIEQLADRCSLDDAAAIRSINELKAALDRCIEYANRLDQREADTSNAVDSVRVTSERSIVALRELISVTGENFSLRMEDLSRRVIDLETEPTEEKSGRKEDAPAGRGSFAEVVAEIERANGIR